MNFVLVVLIFCSWVKSSRSTLFVSGTVPVPNRTLLNHTRAVLDRTNYRSNYLPYYQFFYLITAILRINLIKNLNKIGL